MKSNNGVMACVDFSAICSFPHSVLTSSNNSLFFR